MEHSHSHLFTCYLRLLSSYKTDWVVAKKTVHMSLEKDGRVLFGRSELEQYGLHGGVRIWGLGEKSTKAEREYGGRKMTGGGLWKFRLTSLDLNQWAGGNLWVIPRYDFGRWPSGGLHEESKRERPEAGTQMAPPGSHSAGSNENNTTWLTKIVMGMKMLKSGRFWEGRNSIWILISQSEGGRKCEKFIAMYGDRPVVFIIWTEDLWGENWNCWEKMGCIDIWQGFWDGDTLGISQVRTHFFYILLFNKLPQNYGIKYKQLFILFVNQQVKQNLWRTAYFCSTQYHLGQHSGKPPHQCNSLTCLVSRCGVSAGSSTGTVGQ